MWKARVGGARLVGFVVVVVVVVVVMEGGKF